MERDFLGLSDKKYMSNVKHEVEDDGVGELGLNKKATIQWGEAKFLPNSNLMPANDFQAFPGSLHQWGPVSAANFLSRGQFGGHTFNSFVDQRVASSGPSPQLTIFYAGTVSVFNDISPDKAQAIMLCASNGAASSATHNDSFFRCRDKPATNAMSMIESFNVGPHNMVPSVPQARKASLARFLEKRKERLLSAMPYKKMVLDLSTGEESSGMNYSSTSPTL